MLEAPGKQAPSPDLQRRLKALEQVYSAAQHYLHSGLAEQRAYSLGAGNRASAGELSLLAVLRGGCLGSESLNVHF